MDIKGHGDGGLALLIGPGVHIGHIDLPLCEDPGNIHIHTNPVIGINGAVSYTHLDVYKRQTLYHAVLCAYAVLAVISNCYPPV